MRMRVPSALLQLLLVSRALLRLLPVMPGCGLTHLQRQWTGQRRIECMSGSEHCSGEYGPVARRHCISLDITLRPYRQTNSV